MYLCESYFLTFLIDKSIVNFLIVLTYCDILVYYISKATLKPADKRYSSVNNDYEMTFNQETQVQYCEEEGNLPTMKFNFVSIDQLESHQPNSTVGT